jgi:3-methyladenine DNA glycosylase Tag
VCRYTLLVGKQSASTTEVQQPCDVGNCFKGTKKKLLAINDNAIMMDRIKAVIEKHNQYLLYNSISNTETAEDVEFQTTIANTTTVEATSSALPSSKKREKKTTLSFQCCTR